MSEIKNILIHLSIKEHEKAVDFKKRHGYQNWADMLLRDGQVMDEAMEFLNIVVLQRAEELLREGKCALCGEPISEEHGYMFCEQCRLEEKYGHDYAPKSFSWDNLK